ncbi:MAG: hypothetical protein AAFP04_10170 [Myxococcota bacterium]
MNMSVFVSLVEVAPTEGCILNSSEVAGAMARCYVGAPDAEQAETRIRTSLKEDSFTVVDVEWCVDDSSTNWENPDDTQGRELVNEARRAKDVVYGEFHTWERDS